MVLDALLYFSLAAIFGKDIDGVDKVFKSCCLDLNYPSFKDLAHSFLICFGNYKNAQLLYAVMLLLRGCVWVNKIIFCDSAKLHQRFIHGAYTDPLLPEPLIKSHFLLPGKFYDLSFYSFRIAGFKIEILCKPGRGGKKPRSSLVDCRHESTFFKFPHMIIGRRTSPINKFCYGYGLVISHHGKRSKHRRAQLFRSNGSYLLRKFGFHLHYKPAIHVLYLNGAIARYVLFRQLKEQLPDILFLHQVLEPSNIKGLARCKKRSLSLIHISEPTRLGMNSYAA